MCCPAFPVEPERFCFVQTFWEQPVDVTVSYSPHDGERADDTDSAPQLKLGQHSMITRTDLWTGPMYEKQQKLKITAGENIPVIRPPPSKDFSTDKQHWLGFITNTKMLTWSVQLYSALLCLLYLWCERWGGRAVRWPARPPGFSDSSARSCLLVWKDPSPVTACWAL